MTRRRQENWRDLAEGRMTMFAFRFFAIGVLGSFLAFQADQPLSPVEARKKVGQTITVEMTVQAAKDRLEKRGEIYLDAEKDFRDEKNFAVVIRSEARKKVGQTITVEMTVQAAKDRLEKRGEIYLDAEKDFRDEKNFAVVITRAGAAKFKEAGVTDIAEHFRGKKIRATGTVKEVEKVP